MLLLILSIWLIIGFACGIFCLYQDYSVGQDITVGHVLTLIFFGTILGSVFLIIGVISYIVDELPNQVLIKGKKPVDKQKQ